MISNIEKINKPIIYISITICIASICYGSYFVSRTIPIIIGLIFIILLAIKTNISFTVVMTVFFLLQILVSYNYYTYVKEGEFNDEVRIIEVKSYYTVAQYHGRKVKLINLGEVNSIGEKYNISGLFKKENNVENGIVGNINVLKKEKVEDDVFEIIYGLREKIFYKLKMNLGSRKAALVCSLSYGYREYLDTEDEEEMRDLGIIHAISVSGLHVVLIFSIFSGIVGKKFSLVFVTLYMIITGAVFSTIRAVIMIYINVLSKNVYKNYDPLSALAFSSVILLIIRPYSIFNIGFILSYLSTLGIILFSDKLNKRMYKLPKYIREVLSLQISSQIFTLPVLILVFNRISITSILGNMFIMPILNILIVLGNLLLPIMNIDLIFDFISYVLLKVIRILDYMMNLFYDISVGGIILNEKIAIIYLLSIISLFFIYKGYKKFYMLPISAIIYFCIYLYSPVINIEFIDNSVLLAAYRGERIIISSESNVNMMELKKIHVASKGYININKVKIDNIEVISINKNFILYLDENQYVLKVNNKSKISEDYDIINFINNENKGLYIIGDKLVLY